MPHEDEELDYLAGTQLPDDPSSFVRVVKEVYLLEFDCSQNQDIADVLGVDKSRISQIFGDPGKLKPETIQNLIDPLRSKDNKRRIVESWMRDCFGREILESKGDPLVGKKVTEKTIRRVDRQIRESRLILAARTAEEAATRSEEVTMRERLLDRAFFARQRLDQPGQAMRISRLITEGALARGDLHRAAGGFCFAGRALRGMADSRERETIHLFDQAEALLALEPSPQTAKTPYFLPTLAILEIERINVQLTVHERVQVIKPEATLRAFQEVVTARLKEARSYQQQSRLAQLLARLHLALGEAFLAEELLEKSFKSGELKNLHAYESAGVINARIKAVRESSEAGADYLNAVIENCELAQDSYHRRIAEYDLARLERKRLLESKF
mgnify:CR=1 FL=1